MANDKKETAEQKLLKMIEASSKGDASVAGKKVSQKQGLLVALKTFNKFLFFGLIASVLFLANEVFVGFQLMGKDVSFGVDTSLVAQARDVERMGPTSQRLSFYLAGINQRNIFIPYEDSTKQAVSLSDDSSKIARATRNMKLVGISWMNTVESASVMIEDVKKGETYFLQAGEKAGDIVVKTIYADSVELGYENEEIIIRYDKD